MQKPIRWAEYTELAGLFCLQSMAAAMWLVLLLFQLQAFFSTPTESITTTIIFPRLRYTQEFGLVRASATFGWMCGYWVISVLER